MGFQCFEYGLSATCTFNGSDYCFVSSLDGVSVVIMPYDVPALWIAWPNEATITAEVIGEPTCEIK